MVSRNQFRWISWIGFGVLVGAVMWGMFQARNWALRSLGDSVSQQEWTEYRDDVAQWAESSEAPVRRRVPKSSEPPALVLMRDHFAACTLISVVLSSALYATFVFFLGGTLLPKDVPNTSSGA